MTPSMTNEREAMTGPDLRETVARAAWEAEWEEPFPADGTIQHGMAFQIADAIIAAFTAAGWRHVPEGSVVVPSEVKRLIQLWQEPWGAAKGAELEEFSGDRKFSAEDAMAKLSAMIEGAGE